MTVHAYAWRWITARGIQRADVSPEQYAQIRADWEDYEKGVFRRFVLIVATLTTVALILTPVLWPILLLDVISVVYCYADLVERIYL